MKQVAFAVLLFSSFAMAGGNRNPPDYNTTVHVAASRLVLHHSYFQQLSVVIDG